MQRYMAVSSAKSLTIDPTCSVRLCMYARNKMDSRPAGRQRRLGLYQSGSRLLIRKEYTNEECQYEAQATRL